MNARPMPATPIEVIQRRGSPELRIRWSDGHESVSALRTVRLSCACASCDERRRARLATGESWPPPDDELPASVREPEAREIRAVGGYALTFVWGDGHAHGIYTFPHLRALCECPACAGS